MEPNETIVERILTNDLSCDDLINHLKINSSSSSSPLEEDKETDRENIEISSNSNNKLGNRRLNNDFISYFLSLLHEEGNKYLQILNKTSHATTTASNSTPTKQHLKTNITPTNSTKQRQEQLENKMHTNTPLFTPKSNSKQRRITPQKLTNTPNNMNSSFNNNDRNRRNNSSFTSPNTYSGNIIMNYPSSPINSINNSPKHLLSSKPTNRTPTLADFFSTPIKSPKQANSNILESLKPLQETSELLPSIEKISLKLSLLKNSSEASQDTENKEVLRVKNQAELGLAVKNALNDNEMKKMDNIAKVYSELILNNLVFSLNTELFFLFQLLTLNSLDESGKIENNGKKPKLFASIETCIYFSTHALSHLESILKHLKIQTISELQQNIYIKTFSHFFKENSEIMTNCPSTEELKSKSRIDIQQVRYDADVNVRENFPTNSDALFNASKIQRDTFYDILTDWKNNHKQENWCFYEVHGQRIRELVSGGIYGTNCLWFVKLFQEQFILMCKHDKLFLDKKDDEINGPEYIKNYYDHLKLKRLNARMSTPDPNYGPNPAPKFIGYQEFFKDFIDISANQTFNQLLKDSLNLEIRKIHDEMPNFEDGNENSINKDNIQDLILRSRIIGKFLGYLIFLPYQSVYIPNYLIKEINATRNISFEVNIKSYLERAITNGHLILTVPFIVEFLSMCDENAMSIDVVKETFSMLITIFRSQSMVINSTSFSIDKLFILFSIAWLLQLKIVTNNFLQVNEIENVKNKPGLDSLNMITPFLLHYCCPYLDEFHKLLIRFSYGIKRSLQQINNVSNLFGFEVLKEAPKQSKSNKEIQSNLETYFYHYNPSLKRVVEFISETVSNNFTRNYKQVSYKEILNEYKERFITECGDDEELDKLVRQFSIKCSQEFGKKCLELAKEYSKPKIQDLILLTVSESTNEEVTKVTLLYTIKKTLENVKEWIKINLSEDIFYDEFKNKEFKKRIDGKFLLLSSLNASCVMNNDLEQSKLLNNTMNASSTLENSSFKKEDDEILNASEVLNEIKNSMMLLWNCVDVDIEKLFKRIFKLMQSSSTLLQSYLAQAASELMILFISKQNCGIEEDMFENYYQIESHVNSSKQTIVFAKILCKRNIYLVKTSRFSTVSMSNYKSLIDFLIKKYAFEKPEELSCYKEFFSNFDEKR